MVQRVAYAGFPDIREPEMVAVTNKVLGHIQRSAPSSKDLREWLRDQNLWDKEATPVALEVLDIHVKAASVALGSWAAQMFALDADDAQRTHLWKRLVDQNTLLCKYVCEALDPDGGGRLHSTYELHRMLTSYVYPGAHIRLTDFQAWIKWAVASGRLKLVGIRWGLTDLGKEAVPRLRAVDVDEFLEDEAAEAAGGGDPGAAPAPQAPASPTVSPAATPTKPSKAPPVAAADDGCDEELLDLPPEPEPVDESTFARYAEAMGAPAPEPAPKRGAKAGGKADGGKADGGKADGAKTHDGTAEVAKAEVAKVGAARPEVAKVGAARPEVAKGPGARPDAARAVAGAGRSTAGPATIAAHARLEVGCGHEPPETGEAIAILRKIAQTRGLAAGGALLAAHGVEARMAANEPGRHLFLAALLARLYAIRPDGSLAELLLERAGAVGPLAMLLERPDALGECVVRWGVATPDPAAVAVRTALLDAVIGGRALAARDDLPKQLAEIPSSEMLLGALQQGLLRGAPPTAAFWLIRELVREGVWSRAAHSEIAAVPTRQLRLMAYRLRWIDSHFAGSSARMLEIARRLAALLPPGSLEAAAAEALAPDEHLRFDCGALPICQEPPLAPW